MADITNSPPTTSSPPPSDPLTHGDTHMVDTPADTPERLPSNSQLHPVKPLFGNHSDSGSNLNGFAGPGDRKGTGKGKSEQNGKEEQQFGAPGSCWQNRKWQEECARLEGLLVGQAWSMSQYPDPLERRS